MEDKRSNKVFDLSIFIGELVADLTDALLPETFANKFPSVKAAKAVIDANTAEQGALLLLLQEKHPVTNNNLVHKIELNKDGAANNFLLNGGNIIKDALFVLTLEAADSSLITLMLTGLLNAVYTLHDRIIRPSEVGRVQRKQNNYCYDVDGGGYATAVMWARNPYLHPGCQGLWPLEAWNLYISYAVCYRLRIKVQNKRNDDKLGMKGEERKIKKYVTILGSILGVVAYNIVALICGDRACKVAEHVVREKTPIRRQNPRLSTEFVKLLRPNWHCPTVLWLHPKFSALGADSLDTVSIEQGSTNIGSEIDAGNRARLEKMSPEEIADAQAEIMKKMDSALKKILQEKEQDKTKKNSSISPNSSISSTRC
ncbi:transcriptional elongation regulator MINIYO [Tanacetum coccineum]